ncbi:MAG TPA: hypothetical protein VM100_10760 [Longimicrobiales bacterium]|nr:hypothetical protein [Longimicrobiales bacterium]
MIIQSSFGVPAASFGSTTAFGASGGDLFVGAGYQKRTRYEVIGDGAVSAGFGIGNGKHLAAEVTVTSFSTLRQGFLANGSASVKLHRLLNNRSAVAVGYENAVPWGGTDGGSSLYIVGSKLLPLSAEEGKPFGGIGVSVGVGNGRFRSESAVRGHRAGVNVFGSASVRVLKPVMLIADWTGQDLNAGFALQLPQRWPISISVGFADITRSAGDGARFIAGGGASLHMKRAAR